jgi:1,4-dihydroxy-2-naphthoyl-CoA synthase
MSNETKQTAVEWFLEKSYDLEMAYNQGVINTNTYLKSKREAVEQAKEMEKEQTEQAKLDAKEIIIIKHTEHNGGNK